MPHSPSNESKHMQALLADIQNSAPAAIVIVDKKQRILLFNRGAESIFGYRATNVLGQSFTMCIAPKDHAFLKKRMADAYHVAEAKMTTHDYWEINGRRGNDDLFPLEMALSCRIAKKQAFYTLILHDSTDRKRAATEQESLIDELRALHQATQEIVSELSLDSVLQRVVDAARRLVNVRYAALGIRNEQALITRFVTAGMTVAERARIGPQPMGRGLLGVVFHDGESMIVDNVVHHPAATGFPEHHPEMKRLLSVPIFSKGQLMGALYLADKEDNSKFNRNDLALVEMLAMHAAIAIENAQLYERSQRVSVLEERARFAQDLHDSIIQSLYAEGMMLDQIKFDIDPANQSAHKQLDLSLEMLTNVIQDIRSYIFDLRPQAMQRQGVRARLEGLVQELRVNVRLPVQAVIDPDIDAYLRPEQASHVFHICHEALSNAARHAKAEQIVLRLVRDAASVTISIEDDGVGFNPPPQIELGHRGLANIQARAAKLGAQCIVDTQKQKGTRVQVTFQLT